MSSRQYIVSIKLKDGDGLLKKLPSNNGPSSSISSRGSLASTGGDMASANPVGIRRFTGPGAISYRGCALFNANATGKLAFLSNAVMVVDVEVDASDNTTIKG